MWAGNYACSNCMCEERVSWKWEPTGLYHFSGGFRDWEEQLVWLKNKISYANAEIIKHQHTNKWTISPVPMSLGAHRRCAVAEVGAGWKLPRSRHTGVQGTPAVSGIRDEAAVKIDAELLLGTCWRAAPLVSQRPKVKSYLHKTEDRNSSPGR